MIQHEIVIELKYIQNKEDINFILVFYYSIYVNLNIIQLTCTIELFETAKSQSKL